MSNVIGFMTAGDVDSLLCVEIGQEMIARMNGDIREALLDHPIHATEIVLAAILNSVRRGDPSRQIERTLTTLAAAFEETQGP